MLFMSFWGGGLEGLLAYRACDFLACIYMDLVNLTIFEYIYPQPMGTKASSKKSLKQFIHENFEIEILIGKRLHYTCK